MASLPRPLDAPALALVLALGLAFAGCSSDSGSSSGGDTAQDVTADASDVAQDSGDVAPDTPADLAPDVTEEPDAAAPDVDVSPDAATDQAPDEGGDTEDAEPDVAPPPPLDPLPPAHSASVDTFDSADNCENCHGASSRLQDASGRDISQNGLWTASVMAQAARDPYHLATFSHDLAAHPDAKALIDATCTRCHAPAASATLAPSEGHVSFEALTAGEAEVDDLARDGVTCTLCHQITDDDLGTEASFTGGFSVALDRISYGPQDNPVTEQMTNVSGYTPVFAEHPRESAFCATCHTVITRSLDETGTLAGPLFYEQVPYLEWRNSIYNDEVAEPGDEAVSCGGCHVPATDVDGEPIVAAIASVPVSLDPRQPQGRHDFVGGNAYMLEVFADATDWSGTDATASDLRSRAALTRTMLQTAATVDVSLEVSDELVTATVHVVNETGHKFPTSFPTRRAWLRVALVDDDDEVLWASGRWNEAGELVDEAGARLDTFGTVLPHRDTIDAEDEVQVYESVMVDGDDEPTHVLLDATGYAKDNRLLPHGWSDTHTDAGPAMPVGVDGDANFGVDGDDAVVYTMPHLEDAAAVEVQLVFQSVPPYAVDLLNVSPTPAGVRFESLVRARPPVPEVVATASATLE